MPSNRRPKLRMGPMPSNREIAARSFRKALNAADQRGFERAREMAAQTAARSYDSPNLADRSPRHIAAAIRAIPYAAAEDK